MIFYFCRQYVFKLHANQMLIMWIQGFFYGILFSSIILLLVDSQRSVYGVYSQGFPWIYKKKKGCLWWLINRTSMVFENENSFVDFVLLLCLVDWHFLSIEQVQQPALYLNSETLSHSRKGRYNSFDATLIRLSKCIAEMN